MPKEKMVRIRRKTYEKLSEIADDEDLTISEIADRVLSGYIEELEEEEEEDGDEEEDTDSDSDDEDEEELLEEEDEDELD